MIVSCIPQQLAIYSRQSEVYKMYTEESERNYYSLYKYLNTIIMRRLTIHLKSVEKTVHPKPTKKDPKATMTKIHNTLAFNVSNDAEAAHHLAMHGDNVSKHYFSNINGRGSYALGK